MKIKYLYQLNFFKGRNIESVENQDGSYDGDSMSFLEMSEETFKNLIIKFGKKSTRHWSMKEYKIFEWVLHSDNFLAFFFENKEDKAFYEEIKIFESSGLVLPENALLDNFDMVGKNPESKKVGEHQYEKKKNFLINLSPGETYMLILRIENDCQEYRYRYKTKFKIFGFNDV